MKRDDLDHFLATVAIATTDASLREDIREVQLAKAEFPYIGDYYDEIEIFDGIYDEAFDFAMTQVPKVNHEVWLGQIGDENSGEGESGLWGTYYADSKESRWFPRTSVETASLILAKELI